MEVYVFCDGEWVIVYLSKFVFGDFVRIKSDWLLFCDFLIIKGLKFFFIF